MAKTTARVTFTRTKTFTYTVDVPASSALVDADLLTAANLPTGSNSIGELLAGSVANNGVINVTANWSVSSNTDIEPYGTWLASAPLAVGQRVSPRTPTNRLYVVRVAGTGTATEPTWPAGVGTDIADGTATLTAVDKFGTVLTFAVNTAYTKGQIVKPTAGSTQEYLVITAGTSAATAPTWGTAVDNSVTSNTAVFLLIAL